MQTTEYINKQTAIEALGERPMVWNNSDYELGCANQWDSDELAIKNVPVEDVQIIRYGKWIKRQGNALGYDCTVCRKSATNNHFKYCPNCGAKMEN